ncbi:sulfite exporter TauE/SafE family protein [Lysobacter korlensis]|uniref:Probable membrane transporter protein n=1 Tax=Lysobacter korlensis TaxID=553636 RepID=A0ABV6RPB3_9GAMM
MELPTDFLSYVAIGIAAQLIDGALGMAYGVIASSLLLGLGLPPAVTSATVHAAECFTTGTSALSHRAFGNIDRALFRGLLLPAVLGAGTGAWLLASLDGDLLKPWVASYLLVLGVVIVAKGLRRAPTRRVTSRLAPLGYFGGLIDAAGGGGWGAMVSGNLLARGNEFRLTVGSVNAVEFFVTLTASIVFLLTLGLTHWSVIVGLAVGGIAAAPFGAWFVGRVRPQPMLVAVGLVVIALSVRTLVLHFGAP